MICYGRDIQVSQEKYNISFQMETNTSLRQEAHGPHHSLESLPINKHICTKLSCMQVCNSPSIKSWDGVPKSYSATHSNWAQKVAHLISPYFLQGNGYPKYTFSSNYHPVYSLYSLCICFYFLKACRLVWMIL